MNIKKKKEAKMFKNSRSRIVDIPSRKNEKVLKRMQIHPTEISICKGCEFTRIAKIRKKKKEIHKACIKKWTDKTWPQNMHIIDTFQRAMKKKLR